MRLLRSHGEGSRHHHEMPARTDRLDALQAAILRVKLARLDEANERRRQAGTALRQALAASAVTAPPPPAADGDHVFHLFVVRSDERDALRAHLDAESVASAIHYPTPIHLQPAYADLGLGAGSLPVGRAPRGRELLAADLSDHHGRGNRANRRRGGKRITRRRVTSIAGDRLARTAGN